jgi:multidrug efflux pump
LLFASGAGANSRFGLGAVLITGMALGTLFTLFILPSFYLLMAKDHTQKSLTTRQQQLEQFDLEEGPAQS